MRTVSHRNFVSGLDQTRVESVVDGLRQCRIAVIGDLMLDRYFRGDASRISPEAPVPVVEIREESEHPGGAANVAYNLATLGLQASLFGVAGDDRSGEHLRTLLTDLNIDGGGIVSQTGRPTTVKTRVIADGQHIVRADREVVEPIDRQTEELLLARLAGVVDTLDALIFQDYNKGVLSRRLIEEVVHLANENDVATYVDPKFENFFAFKGVTLFKPNRKETEDALGHSLKGMEDKIQASRTLLEKLESQYVVLTLGSEGMMLAAHGEEPMIVPTEALQVADVSGAGDTVIATLAAAKAAGATMHESVVIANYAAGIVCEQVGTVPIQRDALLNKLMTIHS